MFTYKILFGLVNVNCSNTVAINVLRLTATRRHSYLLYGTTSCINDRHNGVYNRVLNVWNRVPANDCHFEMLRSFKSFIAAQTLTALLY